MLASVPVKKSRASVGLGDGLAEVPLEEVGVGEGLATTAP